ncbi:MAG: pseudaminic acid cytidylyltransferase [Ruminococcaceae bacterium]|nr:pseudaminic acid cytidylyltransferase [Oscillospiraceae bacterium]
MSVIAIITARGGSKRIPRKNIKNFCGEPIIAYSIRAALESGIFDHVMVSTDDEEIAEISRKYGAEVPFMRSAETANDFATTRDVLEEVVRKYDEMGENIEYFCCIYPCAPFVTAKKLRDCFDYLREKEAHSVWTVVKCSPPPQRCFELVDGMIQYKYPEYNNMRSQDLEPLYHDCGQLYFYNKKDFEKGDKHVFKKIFPMYIPETEVQDIDNDTDWAIAEIKYKLMIEK